jgi:MFS family permease
MTTLQTEDRRAVGYIGLVRKNANFRNLWFGQIVSLLGDWFNLIASATLVAQLSDSGFAVGGLFVIRMLAPTLISPLAGVAADRFNRKHLLILTDITRALVVVGFLTVREPQHIWLLYALTALQLAISGIFYPTRNAILPEIVSQDELGTANTISSGTWSIMLALGAALGGLVSGGWGTYPAFVIDALSFLISAFFIARVRYTRLSTSPAGTGQISAAFRQYADGLRYFKKHPDIFAISLQKAAFSLFTGGAFQVVMVALAEDIFVIGEGGGISLGILYAFVGVGTGIGPVFVRYFTGDRERPLRLSLALTYPLSAVGTLLVATLSSFSVVLLGTLLRAIGGGINWVFSTQLLLQRVPDEVRGRIFAFEFAFFTLGSAVSTMAGGWLLDHPDIGLSGLLLWTSGAILIPGALWTIWLIIGKTSRRADPDRETVEAND